MRNLMETSQTTAMAPATIRNCNISLGNMKSLETPMGMLLQIELLVIFTALLLLFLVACGSWRRRYNSRKFQLVIFTAYALSTYVLTYALGLMDDAPVRNELFPIWAMYLMIVLGSSDSISAYSLDENEQWRRYNWQVMINLIWLFLLIGSYWRDSSKVALACQCLFFVLLLKSMERAWSLMAASRKSIERRAKAFADYMSVEHESEGASPDEADPVRMKGYKYLVTSLLTCAKKKRVNNKGYQGKKEPAAARHFRKTLDKDEFVTIEEVWNCAGGLLSSQGDKLKDLCLSYTFALLLGLKYTGYSLPQKAHKKTWNLIRYGLLLEENGCERAFRVIEVELAFVFDFLYTKYLILFQRGWFVFKLLEVIYIIVSIWVTTSLLKNHRNPNITCQLATMPNGLSVDVLVTSVMIILFVIVELMQFFFMSFSEWAKLILICTYVRNESWQKIEWIEWIIRGMCRVQLLNPWERKLRQYSFLESYSYKPYKLLNNVIIAAYIDTLKDGQRQSKSIPLDEEVKQAVFNALKSIEDDAKLKNGQASLTKYSVCNELSWACQLETQTQVIMVWHIATNFCEYKLLAERSESSEMIKNFHVATRLSKYLAYLVAFAPRLLPDHPSSAEYVFDQAIIEARDFFQGCNSMDDQISKMERKGSESIEWGKAIIEQGARLGNQLVDDIGKEMIWKILVDFWVELLLYGAPSNCIEAHAEHLTRGGEFISHLYALLSHAGIERDPPTPTKPCNECLGETQ